MKKIMSWTFGSFFRTIGRTLALILFGILIALLFNKLDIKIPFLSYAKAFTLDNTYIKSSYLQYTACTYASGSLNGCNSYIETNPLGEITLVDNTVNFKKYYFIVQDTYNGTSANPLYFIYTADNPFYVVISNDGARPTKKITTYSTRITVSEAVYNDLISQGKAYQVYFDGTNYYYFVDGESPVAKYIIRSNGWDANPAGDVFTELLAQNVDLPTPLPRTPFL